MKEILEEIRSDITEIKITTAVQTQQLAEHMRRTKMAEQRISKLENLKWVVFVVGAVAAAVGKIMGAY